MSGARNPSSPNPSQALNFELRLQCESTYMYSLEYDVIQEVVAVVLSGNVICVILTCTITNIEVLGGCFIS